MKTILELIKETKDKLQELEIQYNKEKKGKKLPKNITLLKCMKYAEGNNTMLLVSRSTLPTSMFLFIDRFGDVDMKRSSLPWLSKTSLVANDFYIVKEGNDVSDILNK